MRGCAFVRVRVRARVAARVFVCSCDLARVYAFLLARGAPTAAGARRPLLRVDIQFCFRARIEADRRAWKCWPMVNRNELAFIEGAR